MNTEITGPKNWSLIHHLCQEYDKGEINHANVLYTYINSLEKTYSCYFCRESLGPFLEELDDQFVDALKYRKMRRFSYDLHNKVNYKLLDQEDVRVTECLDRNLPVVHLKRSAKSETEYWDQLTYELSCILYTKIPPTYQAFLQRDYPRDEKMFWKSIYCVCHGFTLNESANPEHYDTFLYSILILLWPNIMNDEIIGRNIDKIIHNTELGMTYLKKAWLIQKIIFDAVKKSHQQQLKQLLNGFKQQSEIHIDDIRQIGLQHKTVVDQSFEELLLEMKSYESSCKKANSCRKTAAF
ncbi:MAG: hypothetical protein EOP45_14910 [Sphingobacteriaceae bacterium]|nr:MAG: hypothetical protein EOP45_14910 [Sphingobacteriaceae bacterium]